MTIQTIAISKKIELLKIFWLSPALWTISKYGKLYIVTPTILQEYAYYSPEIFHTITLNPPSFLPGLIVGQSY